MNGRSVLPDDRFKEWRHLLGSAAFRSSRQWQEAKKAWEGSSLQTAIKAADPSVRELISLSTILLVDTCLFCRNSVFICRGCEFMTELWFGLELSENEIA